MDVSFYTLTSAYDDLMLSVACVCPDTAPVAALQLSHGMCGSKERFMQFMEFLASRGVVCFANDHRGHGASVKSEDDLGYMYKGGGRALVDDMKLLTDHIRSIYPGLPVYLLGHSMGSLAARSYLKLYPDAVDGLIICGSPGYNPMAPAGYALTSIACGCGLGRMRPRLIQKFASDIFNRTFAAEGHQAWICSDPQVRRTFLDDPKHNFRFTVNGSRALMALMIRSYSSRHWNVSEPDLPVIFLYGDDDSCNGGVSGIAKAAAVLREAGYRHIRIKRYPAMRHEILNEIGKEGVWQDILEFMGM